MAGSDDVEKRSYFRVATVVPVRARVLAAAEADALCVEVQTRRHPDLSGLDDGLRAWLARLEDKLDRLLGHFETDRDDWITADGPLTILLSGSGLRVPVLREVPQGAAVLVDVTLPEVPKIVARAVTRVEACHGGPKRPELALSFQAISVADRDAIVAHCLERQRHELRKRADA